MALTKKVAKEISGLINDLNVANAFVTRCIDHKQTEEAIKWMQDYNKTAVKFGELGIKVIPFKNRDGVAL